MQRLIVEDENGMLNFGHSGRPGNIGGSSAGGGGVWSGGAGGDSTIFGSIGEHPATPMMQSNVGTRTFSGVEVTNVRAGHFERLAVPRCFSVTWLCPECRQIRLAEAVRVMDSDE